MFDTASDTLWSPLFSGHIISDWIVPPLSVLLPSPPPPPPPPPLAPLLLPGPPFVAPPALDPEFEDIMELETEVGEAGLSDRWGDELIELECECDDEDEWCVCWAVVVGWTGAL